MPMAQVLGADLYYERHGEGPALVFAHGLGGNHLVWWQQVPYFRERYTCITYDAPGFGVSGEPPGEDWTFVDCLAGLLDTLEIDRVRLIGQSMGGVSVLPFTLRHPERVAALVMSSTMLPLALPDGAEDRRLSPEERQAMVDRGVVPSAGGTMAREQPTLQFLYNELSALNTRYYAGNWPPGGLRVPKVKGDELRDYRTPTLFILGEDDPIFPPALLEQAVVLVPGARAVRFPRRGHSVYFEEADGWNRAVDSFLNEVG
jgi:pimeloyl-ACP methyl ester carboxylesterase